MNIFKLSPEEEKEFRTLQKAIIKSTCDSELLPEKEESNYAEEYAKWKVRSDENDKKLERFTD
ncbi:MAG: hypothetical protein HOG49_22530 [Candidatus Scalindua sp.]|jgi:hypothetical protein|nr:hypothetical protein [Candidatus Scalindua sp.]